MSEHRNKLWFILLGQQPRKKVTQSHDTTMMLQKHFQNLTYHNYNYLLYRNYLLWKLVNKIIINKHSLDILKKYNYDQFIMKNVYLQNNGSN